MTNVKFEIIFLRPLSGHNNNNDDDDNDDDDDDDDDDDNNNNNSIRIYLCTDLTAYLIITK